MFVLATLMSYVSQIEKRREEKGATAVEYALLTAGIAIGLFGAVTLFGTALKDWFTGLGGKVGLV